MTTHDSHRPLGTAAATASLAARVLPVTFAALLGVVVLGGVGFSHIEAVHNASHDVRHATAFPCH
ncbi:CbtB domain-containing protein [Ancylobacter terrae]|uniref:CbtB domain-containing protein n=1 Tax=Ancylobacter sp. sgz301288 TaxID=3342077 RepID=UPI00385B92E7